MLTCATCGRESPDDFAFCPACASPLTPATPATETRRTVSVVFCDVSGSTELGERLDPEPLRDVQTRYFDAMRAAIERHGGTVEKYIGDAVMAVFGIPRLHEDDALRAARAAVDMRAALASLNDELARDRGVTLAVRIGVNTGEVVAGDPAAGQALVTGDAVNIAARLEQAAQPGEILLGAETHRLVRGVVDAEPVAPLAVKGKAAPVNAWRLDAVRDAVSSIPRAGRSPMVGRARQLAHLAQAFDAVVEDRACQLVTVFGAAGVGKSRLVDEFLAGLLAEVTVLTGRCLPYGDGITYHPVIESIKQAAGLADFDPPATVESKVCAVLEADEHQELVCRRVAQLLGIAGAGAGEETAWAIRRFYEAVARERPLVLVFDDVQWGEPTFLDLLDHLADWSGGSPILLICMARPDLLETRPGWGGGKLRASTVALEPLREHQTADLIANLLGGAEAPAPLREAISGRAEGNPLFVEETIAMLIDEGALVRTEGGWRPARELTGLTVPPSIQALLAARLDRLAPDERGVLEAASVIGRDAFIGAVRELVAEDARPSVADDLLGLVRKELLHPIPSTLPGEDAFRFRHLLLRDAAYDAIPKGRRAELHERCADWLERVGGDAVTEVEEIVGYHLEQAHAYRIELGPDDERSIELGRRAATRLASAGRRAAERDDLPAAVGLLTRAAALAPPDDPDRGWMLFRLGIETEEVGDERAAIAAMEEAVRIADRGDDPSLAWRGRIALSEFRNELDPGITPTDELRDEIEAAIRALEAVDDDAGLADAWTRLGFIMFMPCRYDDAARAEERAVAYARACGDDRLLFLALRLLVLSESFGSMTPEEGLRRLDELRDDIVRSRSIEVVTLAVRSRYESLMGSTDDARRTIDRAIEIAESVGMRFFIAICLGFRAENERRAGDVAAAEAVARRSYEILEAAGSMGIASTHAADLAVDLAELGRLDEAERFAAIGRTAAPDDLPSQTGARCAEALVAAARGEHEHAEAIAREVTTMVADAQWPEAQGNAWMILATVLRAGGHGDEAADAARGALASFEPKGSVPEIAAARRFLDELGGSGPADGP